MEDRYIVLGEKNGLVQLVSSEESSNGLVPVGAFLTIKDSIGGIEFKTILRVKESTQISLYEPTPLIADMLNSDFDGRIDAERLCKNKLFAYRVSDNSLREDGKINFIRPQSIAIKSTQSEVDMALGMSKKSNGPKIFPATIYSTKNQKLKSPDNKFINVSLPLDFYWHQTQICGATGSGKTVASKYLAQHFVNTEFNLIGDSNNTAYGCVLAINVKDQDFLTMNKPSEVKNAEVIDEWKSLNGGPAGCEGYAIYYNSYETKLPEVLSRHGVSKNVMKPITLSILKTDPKSLLGIVQDLTSIQQNSLPDIFRYWQADCISKGHNKTIYDFTEYFRLRKEDYSGEFMTMNVAGNTSKTSLTIQTCNSILTKLQVSQQYFDDYNGTPINADDILQGGKFSVLEVVGDIGFGSIALRELLKSIVEKKTNDPNTPPILIVIDEIHKFYSTESSSEALAELDTICRTGRSKQIGVIFSSQEKNDLPKGLSNVVNTKLFFKSNSTPKTLNSDVSSREMSSLKPGFCVGNIHGLPNLNVFKFPVSFAGVKFQ